MKNLAGNDVSIFLFRFVLRKNAISFVLNESIAEDIYPEIEEQLQPLTQVCGETLMRYKHLCQEEVILDGNVLVDGNFEVMLSAGLGKHFVEKEKQNLFNDTNEIANLLMDVMDKTTKEIEQGNYAGPQPVIPKIQRSKSTNEGLEALGRKRKSLAEFGLPIFAGEITALNRLKPDDLPQGVLAKRGYDHRGHCYAFEHVKLGELGKIIVIGVDGCTRIEAELYKGNASVLPEKTRLFEEVFSIVEDGLRNTVKTI